MRLDANGKAARENKQLKPIPRANASGSGSGGIAHEMDQNACPAAHTAMRKRQASDAAVFVALRHLVPTSSRGRRDAGRLERVRPMHFTLPHLFRDVFGLKPHDEHLLAGADEEAVQALGVSQPVLAGFKQDVAVLCPDLVHEAQLGIGRR